MPSIDIPPHHVLGPLSPPAPTAAFPMCGNRGAVGTTEGPGAVRDSRGAWGSAPEPQQNYTKTWNIKKVSRCVAYAELESRTEASGL